MGTDGRGVSTLVAFWGCPLRCHYCINDFCHDPETPCEQIDPKDLVQRLMADEIYYRMSGGGIVFGGGEPLQNSRYIRNVINLLPKDIPIRIETSLNVPWEEVELLYGLIDEWIIDIKDINSEIYVRYTGQNNKKVVENISLLTEKYHILGENPKEHILFRIPIIPDFNTQEDVDKSLSKLKGYGKTELFEYECPRF